MALACGTSLGMTETLETIFTLSANIMSYLIYKAKVKHRRIDVGSSETV